MCEDKGERPQISVGKLISRDNLMSNELIHEQAKTKLKKSDFYLVILVPGEEILKVNIFAAKNSKITKILVELAEFTPQTVEGIGDVLTNYELCDCIIHTTGLCFSGSNCFYESYMDMNLLDKKDFSIEKLKESFLKIDNVKSINLIAIE
jgi:hypothetical protein